MENKSRWRWGLAIVFMSGVICFILSVSNPGWEQSGLGGVLFLAWAAFAMVIGIILYAIVTLLLKNQKCLVVALVISVLTILYGVHLHYYD